MSEPTHENHKRQSQSGSAVKRNPADDTRKKKNGRRSRRSSTSRHALRAGWRRSRIPGRPNSQAEARAERVVQFIECLRVPSGVGQGKRFKLREWQRDFIFAIYSNCYPNDRLRTATAILSIARKNGKTALIAALVLVHLIGPEAGYNEDICSAANDRDQAAQVFKYTKQIISLSPMLSDNLSVVDSTKRIAYHACGNVYAALSSDAGTKHGMNPRVVIYDELAQSKNRELFDALETSQGAQEEPLFITISTQSNDPQHPLSQMIDDGLESNDPTIVCHLYAVPEDVIDIFDEDCWYDANPALGDFRKLSELRKYAAKAKRLPSFENTLRNLYLNQRVSHMSTLFTRTIWQERQGNAEFEPGERVFLALDFAQRVDLAALAIIGEETAKLDVYFWKPEDLFEEHGKRDRMDYELHHRKGFMEDCPGKVIDPAFVAKKIAQLYGHLDVIALAYDRWRIDGLVKSLNEDCQIDARTDEDAALRLVPWGQGFRDMAPAVEAFETAAVDGSLIHSGNPVLTWNIANAVVVQDPAGNRKLDKEKSRMRIDGAVAATMAAGLRARFMQEDTDDGSYLDDDEEMVVL